VSVFFPNQWHNVPVRQIVSEHFNLPILVDNDANAAALGERLFGAARVVDDFIYVIMGMGIGAGICINGHIYRVLAAMPAKSVTPSYCSATTGLVTVASAAVGKRWPTSMR
jgi:predicted NBD/HSP70 family sugar kinase